MTRVRYRWGVGGLAAIASAVSVLVMTAPAGATLVCPPGNHNPSYCTNVPPVAITGKASPVLGLGATLNGTSGPGIPGGDVTSYYFEWGESTTYGNRTPTGTVGSCPKGTTTPTYCPGVPPAQYVSSDIGGLIPCQVYHFRIVSTNPDGTTKGADSSFHAAFNKPFRKPHVPKRVKHGHKFTVHVKLLFKSFVQIQIRRGHHLVKNYNLGVRGPGLIKKKLRAPKRRGRYYVRFIAKEECGTQTWDRNFRVF